MVNNKTALFAAVIALGIFGVTGCTPKESADNGGGTTEGAMERAGKTVDQGGEAVKEGTKEAVKETGEAVGQAGEAVGAAGTAVKESTKEAVGQVGETVGGAVKGVAKETQDAGQALKITPGVKNALIASKEIDASTLNVNTDAELDTVIIKGTQPTAAKQKLVTSVAQKALDGMGSKFKIKNQVTVAK